MCGIHVAISSGDFLAPGQDLKHLLCNRGPDHIGEAQGRAESDGIIHKISFTSTVLGLRGGHVTPQPFVDQQSGSILCWNGEAWKIGPDTVVGNDGERVFEAMLKASATQNSLASSGPCVLEALKSICGPFAFVFFDNTRKYLYFGRDRLGRRSLLYHIAENTNTIKLSSVSDPKIGLWNEVEADGIYVLSWSRDEATRELQHLDTSLMLTSRFPVHKYAWEVEPRDHGHIPQRLQGQRQEAPDYVGGETLNTFNP
jgi:asparagine synthetase B (glutamine-hydrolysing)